MKVSSAVKFLCGVDNAVRRIDEHIGAVFGGDGATAQAFDLERVIQGDARHATDPLSYEALRYWRVDALAEGGLALADLSEVLDEVHFGSLKKGSNAPIASILH